ncbi:MAG: heme exporter protein CcmD [Betaproteobacteria bacterium]|nr:MAG: heme exporter protein CcmD [Betaproteobacteria bacterium]
MIDWLAMGGYAGYVWGSYGVTLLVIWLELGALAKRRRRALERARAELEAVNGN